VADAAAFDPFRRLRASTPARIGLGRAGQGLPTAPMLAFQLAHARARDAVSATLDVEAIAAGVGRPVLIVDSAARDRETYLRNPDFGRRLAPGMDLARDDHDLAIVIADGLSAQAANLHGAALALALLVRLEGWSVAPIVLARQARVALGDPVASALGARAVVVLIGERPGLSTPRSLSAYLTWSPRPGRLDSERNCVSNIHEPHGLSLDHAADKIAWLLGEARRLGFTGVDLKDRHDPLPTAARLTLNST
jgi:ethanolamine ammonia-lyase small subunit